jgi:2-amino-4-hydroxy-6-hydroxymethyldihydropteridine diphosphokinase
VVRAAIALGSNLGDRLRQLRAGLDGLQRLGTVVAVSSLYETEPVGGPVQGRYLNAAVLLETRLEPDDLLAGLQKIEGERDRTREVRWGPRTLDLDLITYDDRQIVRPELEVPHPRAHERRFVLAPLLDVAPDVTLADGSHPTEAIDSVMDQAIDRWSGAWPSEDPTLGREAWRWVWGQVAGLTVWLLVVVPTARPVMGIWMGAGAVVAASGLGLGIAAVTRFEGTITPSPQPRVGAHLVSSGAYRLVRHPMYGAVFLSTLGVGVAVRSWAGVLVALGLAVFLRFKSAREERILGIVLGDYSDYRQSVTHRMIPYLW